MARAVDIIRGKNFTAIFDHTKLQDVKEFSLIFEEPNFKRGVKRALVSSIKKRVIPMAAANSVSDRIGGSLRAYAAFANLGSSSFKYSKRTSPLAAASPGRSGQGRTGLEMVAGVRSSMIDAMYHELGWFNVGYNNGNNKVVPKARRWGGGRPRTNPANSKRWKKALPSFTKPYTYKGMPAVRNALEANEVDMELDLWSYITEKMKERARQLRLDRRGR